MVCLFRWGTLKEYIIPPCLSEHVSLLSTQVEGCQCANILLEIHELDVGNYPYLSIGY